MKVKWQIVAVCVKEYIDARQNVAAAWGLALGAWGLELGSDTSSKNSHKLLFYIGSWTSRPLHIARDSADPRSNNRAWFLMGRIRVRCSPRPLDQGSVLPFRLLHRHLLMCQHYWSQIRCSWLLQSSTSDQGSVPTTTGNT